MTWLNQQIYSDFKGTMNSLVEVFNSQLLPAIQQWAVLTKDYVLDLFGRYIQYSIALDILSIVLILIVLYLFIFFFKKVYKYDCTLERSLNQWAATTFYSLLAWTAVFISTVHWVMATKHLIQTIFLPELTIYEKIIELKEGQH